MASAISPPPPPHTSANFHAITQLCAGILTGTSLHHWSVKTGSVDKVFVSGRLCGMLIWVG
jgi:hypothetical protein